MLSYGQAQARAREWFDLELERDTGESRKKGSFTVRDAWELYLADCKRRGVKGLDQMENAAKNHILPELGHIDVAKLRSKRIEDWHAALAESAAMIRGGHTKPAPSTPDEFRARKDTANRVLTILKAMLGHSKRKRRVSVSGDAWKEAKPFKGTSSARVRFLSTEEAQRLVNTCDHDFRLLVKAALFTGARFGELTRLLARDFDSKGGKGRGTVFIAESKSGRPRHVALAPEGLRFFQEVTAGMGPNELVFTREAFPDQRRVDPETGKPLSKVQREWRKSEQQAPLSAACEAAGIGKLVFHELRHTAASLWLNAGIPLTYVAAQLGHADTRMVEKHYGHLAPSALADAIATLTPDLNIHASDGIAPLSIKHA